MRKASSGICGQRRPRSACASAQAVQDLRCPLTESSDTIACINEDKCQDEILRTIGKIAHHYQNIHCASFHPCFTFACLQQWECPHSKQEASM